MKLSKKIPKETRYTAPFNMFAKCEKGKSIFI